MRILVFGLSANRAGVESVILTFCNEALQHGLCEFDFVVFDEIPSFARPFEAYGCRFFVVPPRTKAPKEYRRGLERAVAASDYDYVWYNVCTLSDITLLKVAKERGIATVLHAHNSKNMGNVLNLALHNRHKKAIEAYADVFLAASAEAAAFTFPLCIAEDSKRWILVRNGIPIEQMRFDPKARSRIRCQQGWQGKTVIGNVGRLHPQKNHPKMIDIFEVFHRDNPDSLLVFIGSGPKEQSLKTLVDSRGLQDCVIFIGAVDNTAEWLSALDLFLFPSLYEGLGIALVEAQACGLCCLASDVVPDLALCTPNATQMPLEADASQWSAAMEGLLAKAPDEVKRLDAWKDVCEAGFDVAREARRLFDQLKAARKEQR